MIIFAEPLEFMLLILPFVFYVLTPPVKGMHGDALKVPFIADLKKISLLSGGTWDLGSSPNKITPRFVWMYILWGLLCIAAARPQIIGEPICHVPSGENLGNAIRSIIRLRGSEENSQNQDGQNGPYAGQSNQAEGVAGGIFIATNRSQAHAHCHNKGNRHRPRGNSTRVQRNGKKI